MAFKCPSLAHTAIVADDPHLAAALSSALARTGTYLPVIDGPRLTRPDRSAEVIRRNNALARVRAEMTLLAGLSDEGAEAMMAMLPSDRTRKVSLSDVASLTQRAPAAQGSSLRWGHDRIGIGLLRALYGQQLIEFSDEPSPAESVQSRSGHLVICEAGEPLSEVIAANYAYALNAGLHLIEETDEVEAKQLLEAYYSIDAPGSAPGEVRSWVQNRLREMCGSVELPPGGSLTFVTRQLPFGAAFPELPSTHLFNYPDLGIAIINGFAAEQPGSAGTNLAVLVDPEKVRAPEIDAATKLLPKRRMFVRGYSGRGATVRAITEMVDLFPYDLLIFATHCGDVDGYRWTYEFRDSEGLDRTLVVDIAVGFAHTDDPEMLSVTQFMRFHSLDGVDWSDPIAKAKLHVGTAIRDFSEWEREDRLKPTKKETIPRVAGSAAMAMAGGEYLAMPRSLAAEGSPIVINNACVSWHELAGRFTFANARAYLGTIFPVSDSEAEAVIVHLLDKFFGKPLPHALWAAQNAVYGTGGNRRPYLMTGVYPQRLRTTRQDMPKRILGQLVRAADGWRRRLSRGTNGDEKLAKRLTEIVTYYEREIAAFRKRWSI